jgi:hypothetical protein
MSLSISLTPKEKSMRTALVALTVLLSTALPAAAQKPDVKGGTVTASEPGKAAVVRAAEVSAQVVAIDKATRTLSLKGPKGKVVEMVAGEEVKNFNQIKVGDMLFVRFMQSLALELQKTKSADGGITGGETVMTAKPGERPAVAAAREVSAIAKVTAVDPKAKTMDLKGPRGNTVTIDVQNQDHFKVVKVGDEVMINYTEAVAVSIEPAKKTAAKPAAKKAEAKK